MKNNGIENLKKRTLTDTVCSIIVAIISLCIALLIVSFIFIEIRKNGKPFSKVIIWELRILAITIMVGAYAPDIITNIVAGNTVFIEYIIFSSKNLLITALGVSIGMLSEIFVYGYELQEDMDSIA